jgi:hypothetical protein
MSLSDVSITSDKDYLKIFQDGQVLISANGTPDADSTYPADPNAPTGFAGSQTITHNLGTVPLVRAYWDKDKNGRWYNALAYVSGVPFDPRLKIIVTTSTLKLIMGTDGGAKTNIPVFYRIYDFGSKSMDSDRRIDKIFLVDDASGVVSAAAVSDIPNQTVITIPHGAGEAPLFTIEFSENQSDWYSEGSQIVGGFDTSSGPPGGPYAYYYYTTASASVDATNLYLTLESNYATSKTIYVRFALDYRA